MNARTGGLDSGILALLQEAARWRLLGRLFECPSPGWFDDIAALSADARDPELDAAVAAALEEGSEGRYHSVFGPGGPAPPREVSYHDTLELGSVMSSVAVFYEAFGYRPALEEAPDHVAVEAGFLSYLRVKQAFAAADGDAERAAVTAEAIDAFRRDHLAVLAGRLAAVLADAPLAYLQSASRLLAARVGPPPGPRRLTVIQDPVGEEDGGAFACGLG